VIGTAYIGSCKSDHGHHDPLLDIEKVIHENREIKNEEQKTRETKKIEV
jgi:hypothetical protein